MSDALTSILAIAALLAGQYAGWWFLDPLTGLLAGALIVRWAVGLGSDASRLLLDEATSPHLADRIARRLESIDDVRVAGLRLWELGPGRRGCIVSLVSGDPQDVAFYRREILAEAALAHLTVEVHRCDRAHVRPAA